MVSAQFFISVFDWFFCINVRQFLCVLSSAEKARLHAEAKAAEVTKRKAEAEAALLEKQKREVEREEARRALQRVLLIYPC